MRVKKIALLVMLTFMLVGESLNAKGEKEKELLELAKTMMPSTTILNVKQTEISNMLVVLLANEEIVYLVPSQKLIFIGEIYTTDGVSVSEKHMAHLGAKNTKNNSDGTLDISPLFKVSTRMKIGNSPYGLIVFTDPECPFCQQLDIFLNAKDITVDHIFTPIDALHPNARAKAIKIVMEKNTISEEEAIMRINEGEKIASALGIKGTPQSIVYEIQPQKPVNAIVGADTKAFGPYLKGKLQ